MCTAEECVTSAPLLTVVSVRMRNNGLVSILLSRYHVQYSTGIGIAKTYSTVSTDPPRPDRIQQNGHIGCIPSEFQNKSPFPLCFIKAKSISKQGKVGVLDQGDAENRISPREIIKKLSSAIPHV